MTVTEALSWGNELLSRHSSTPHLDAEVILSHLLGIERSALLAHPAYQLNTESQQDYRVLIDRRTRGEPVAYLTGHKEFYGLDLVVSKDGLVPRPETESVVEACLELLPTKKMARFADVGTGSGAILV